MDVTTLTTSLFALSIAYLVYRILGLLHFAAVIFVVLNQKYYVRTVEVQAVRDHCVLVSNAFAQFPKEATAAHQLSIFKLDVFLNSSTIMMCVFSETVMATYPLNTQERINGIVIYGSRK